ncbi:unnamed protein product [Hermetia illucens]|uniref:Sugar phosphate phosphatase n=1 Tax=Hermetia illucens TaxID=343691 RepID=A0A7R8UYH9_HERIL|nr:damage-control phosphatase ARMT1-like [Hermetia illucens]CAD7089490.1 unnamed protein product [Hermetia illucens]
MGDFDKKYNIVDEKTPPHELLSGHYKQSFAYYTLRERLPVILTQVVDNLSRDKDEIAEKFGDGAREELKEIVGNISKLKYELQTDKELTPISGTSSDVMTWNIFLSSLNENSRSFFNACWLHSECYMYRRLRSIFELSTHLRDFDYFQKQKENALTCCTESLEKVAKSIDAHKEMERKCFKDFFRRLLKLNLWGNRCDLSISAGKEIIQTGDPYTDIDILDKYILVDQSADVWECVSQDDTKDHPVTFIHDNSGFEIFTDFLLADFIIEQNLASKVRFHVKAIPWYISDVTPHDFHWTIDYLLGHQSETLRTLGSRWKKYLENGKFELCPVNFFWTSPFEFYKMAENDKKLYTELGESKLVIFKGDLNYRKLIGDYNWDRTESFETCLRGFRPSNVCTLRTIKADLICGLKEGVGEELDKSDPDWMVTGKYGVIQFALKN